MQSHLRTSVAELGGVETDELYVGVDRYGVHYVLPLQAKGGRDKLGVVQIEQDIALCAEKFPSLVCRPIAAQFMRDDVIALFEFEVTDEQVTVRDEKHRRCAARSTNLEQRHAVVRARQGVVHVGTEHTT